MKKLITLIPLVALLCTSCAGSMPSPSTSPSVSTAVEIARAAARIGLSVALQNKGVSAEDTTKIMAELREIADAVIAGEGLAVLHNAERWASLRAELTGRLASVITSHAKVKGVQVIDDATARLLVSQLLDTFASAVRKRIPPPAA